MANRFGERTFDRIATDLAIIGVAVPIGLALLVPPFRGRGACGTTLENGVFWWSVLFLAARFSWIAPKALVDLDNWIADGLERRRDAFAAAKPANPSPWEDP